MQKEEKKIDLGLFFELAQKKQDYVQSSGSKHSGRDFEKVKNGFFLNGYFTLGNGGEIATNSFLRW